MAEASSTPLFKMVAFRGPDPDSSIDPSATDGIQAHEAGGFRVVERERPEAKAQLRQALQDLQGLSNEDLDGFAVLAGLRDNLAQDTDLDIAEASVVEDGGAVALPSYASSAQFRTDYQRLYSSWLRTVIRDRLLGDSQSAADPELADKHVGLIRAAHLLARLARGVYHPRANRKILRAPVVLPRVYLRPAPLEKPVVDREKRLSPMREALAETIREREKVLARLKVTQRLERALPRIVAAAQAREGAASGAKYSEKTSTLDATTLAMLRAAAEGDSRDGSEEQAVARTILARLEVMTPDDLAEHGGAINSNDFVEEANKLCEEIHLYEDEIRDHLPPPGSKVAADRPAIRLLEWGDLIVAESKLVGYAANEISHIENILAGEKKKREHERTVSVEELVEEEAETETESERDLETSDRFELETESAETLRTDFSISTGVNTSGKYGLTRVATQTDLGLQVSNERARHETQSTATEIVERSLERTREKVRKLRRTTRIETLRELSFHKIDNTTAGVGLSPEDRAGIYYWVDKVEEVQLHQYGKRLFVEFYIPEPAVTLLEVAAGTDSELRKPARFQVTPQKIGLDNYMCLTGLYQAEGVEAPPHSYVQVGRHWTTGVRESANRLKTEDTISGYIKIPDGYVPEDGWLSVTGRGVNEKLTEEDESGAKIPGRDIFNAHVSVAGHTVLDELGQIEEKKKSDDERATHYYKEFRVKPFAAAGDLGIPVACRLSGHHDNVGTLNVTLKCVASYPLMQRWRLDTYEKLRAAHAQIVEDYELRRAQEDFQAEAAQPFSSRPPATNRDVERDELKKWAIKMMLVSGTETDPLDFDAVESVETMQEISPAGADALAPKARFLESAFEWQHMSYFAYPYFWGRRDSWHMRQRIRVPNDPRHEAFLRAGFVRAVVPILPGFESRVMQFLDDNSEIPTTDREDGVVAPLASESLWAELMIDRGRAVAWGNTRVQLTKGSVNAELVPPPGAASSSGGGSHYVEELAKELWELDESLDLHRRIYLQGREYRIVEIGSDRKGFKLDKGFHGETGEYAFLSGPVPYGEPWEVRVPTRLVYLQDEASAMPYRLSADES